MTTDRPGAVELPPRDGVRCIKNVRVPMADGTLYKLPVGTIFSV